jgi:hypothetical protein
VTQVSHYQAFFGRRSGQETADRLSWWARRGVNRQFCAGVPGRDAICFERLGTRHAYDILFDRRLLPCRALSLTNRFRRSRHNLHLTQPAQLISLAYAWCVLCLFKLGTGCTGRRGCGRSCCFKRLTRSSYADPSPLPGCLSAKHPRRPV